MTEVSSRCPLAHLPVYADLRLLYNHQILGGRRDVRNAALTMLSEPRSRSLLR